jgi:hypothetical protein
MSIGEKDSLLKDQFPPEVEARKFNVTIYTGDLTIVGSTILTIDIRSSSRRTSDFVRTLKSHDFLTISDAKVIDRPKNKIIDKPDYILVSLAQVDAIYAEDSSEIISEGKLD